MLAHTSNTRNIMNSNISLEEQRPRESMALLFAQETRWAVLEKVNQYTRLVCFVLQCLQAVREPSLAIESLYPGEQPFKLRLDITDLPPYRSDVISTNCWPTCTAAQLQGSFSPFHLRRLSTFYAAISYVYFALFLPTLVSLRIARSLPTIAFIARNVKRLFHPAFSLLDRVRIVRRDSANLYRALDVWIKRREERGGEWNFNINICKGPCCCSRYVDAWPNNCGWNGTKIFGTFKRDCWNVCLSYIGENEWELKCDFQSCVWKFSFQRVFG